MAPAPHRRYRIVKFKEKVTQEKVTQKRVTDGGLEARYERYRSVINRLTLMSDVLMSNVLNKPECAEYILQVILQKKLKVREVVVQKDYKNLQGRSAILDCVASDDEGRRFDIEVQQESEGASPKRARYHSGLLDMNTLNQGEDFEELPEAYVIFITRKDCLGYGLPIYHIHRTIRETGTEFGDEANIIYVSAANNEDTELGRLMHDFQCSDAEDMYSEVLAGRVRELKETQEGVDTMCEEMKELLKEIVDEEVDKKLEEEKDKLYKEGETRAKKETARSLANMGMPVDNIAQAVNSSVQRVREWLSENLAQAD